MGIDEYACAGCFKDSATMDICEDGGTYCPKCKSCYCYDCFGLSVHGYCHVCEEDVEYDYDIGE